ncbi:MAG: hypothetical protein U0744_13070 [Gemmataceae bacterium]
MHRYLGLAVLSSLILIPLAQGGGAKVADVKEALTELQPFIGGWKGGGSLDKDKSAWKEDVSWSWRFKEKDVWLSFDFEKSKVLKSGEIRYLPAKKVYEMTTVDAKGNKATFTAKLVKGALQAERTNPETKDVEQVKINTAGDGVRLIWSYFVKPADRTIASRQYMLQYTKEGESFGVAAGKKGPECVVTGGLGTMPVSFNGQTYYVCCTGCRDAFNENPAKILKEYAEKKKKER